MWYPLHLLYGRLWPTPPMYAWPGFPACWNAVTGAAARPCILALHFERTKWPGILAVAWCVHHRMALASCGPALCYGLTPERFLVPAIWPAVGDRKSVV